MSEQRLKEKRLIRRLKRREEAAFSELVTQQQGRVFNVCYRLLGNSAEAEDITQDVFVKAFKAIGSFRGDSALSTWLYRIAVNLCKNRLKYLARRSYRTVQNVDDVPERAWASEGTRRTVGEAAPRPDEIFEGNHAERQIHIALHGLEPGFRELLVLRDVQGLSYTEVMVITGLPEGTVKSRLHRARIALRLAYEALEAE